jgi:hypothetical protein
MERLRLAITWVLLLSVVGCSVLEGTGPVPFTKKAYTATYKRDDFNGIQQSKMEYVVSSDGKGHLRTDFPMGMESPAFLICDYLQGKSYTLYPTTRTGIWAGLKNSNAFLGDAELLQASQPVSSLGEKVIDGYSCKGYKWTIATGYVDLWFGKKEGCLVYGEDRDFPSTKRNAWWVVRLKKYSAEAMPAKAFSLDGYRITPLP